MFIFSVKGLIFCLIGLAVTMVAAWKVRPDGEAKRSDQILYLLFQLSVASSVWGLAAPRIGSAVTTFRVSILLFAGMYTILLFRRRENPLKGLETHQRLLLAIMGFMAAYGVVTLFFLSDARGYTFSRLVNLCFDFLLCVSIMLYGRRAGILRSLMVCLTVTLVGQYVLAVYECFTGPMYTDTHINAFGPSFFSFFNLRLPSGPTFNTNDFSASLFFMGMPVLIYWLYHIFTGKSGKGAMAVVTTIFTCQWFVSHCGGVILVQIAIIIFFIAVAVPLFFLFLKKRKCYFFPLMVVPLLVVVLQFGASTSFSFENTVSPSSDRTSLSVSSSNTHASDPVAPNAASSETPESVPNSASSAANGRNDFTGIGTGSAEAFKLTTYYRVTLLRFSIDTFFTHPLGVGLGNTQYLAEIGEINKNIHIYKLHCYGAECLSDFGIIWAFLILAFFMVYLRKIISSAKRGSGFARSIACAILLLVSLPCAVFTSTAPGCAQDLMAMWIYFAIIVLMPEFSMRTKSSFVPKN